MNARLKLATRLKGSSGALTCVNSTLPSNQHCYISEGSRIPNDVYSQEILEDDQEEECGETHGSIVYKPISINFRGRKT